ncbi:hypothetical protein K466DRAFT_284011 [Polyporus arcularius HHB13444]|uniref:Uncharacterized protein n=1 Tax=Polyporus arcularius HHB13444 TaxID=1314778 RepID=A0A5C3PAJ5_9APHY|nr:hypothetical protein K466DRAFT_284011 [Polyporus arcularius HHB13444]
MDGVVRSTIVHATNKSSTSRRLRLSSDLARLRTATTDVNEVVSASLPSSSSSSSGSSSSLCNYSSLFPIRSSSLTHNLGRLSNEC